MECGGIFGRLYGSANVKKKELPFYFLLNLVSLFFSSKQKTKQIDLR